MATLHYRMNPLGSNLWWAWDIIALIITFVVIQALVLVNGRLQKRELLLTYITRKIIHIFAAPLFAVCWLLYSGSGAMAGKLAALQPAHEAVDHGLRVHVLTMMKKGRLLAALSEKKGAGTMIVP
jgi:ABC-type arginine/histidine transport system permease subunit